MLAAEVVLQVLVEQLRQQCLEEKVDKHAEAVKAYSALTQSPKEWSQEVSQDNSSAAHFCLSVGLSVTMLVHACRCAGTPLD